MEQNSSWRTINGQRRRRHLEGIRMARVRLHSRQSITINSITAGSTTTSLCYSPSKHQLSNIYSLALSHPRSLFSTPQVPPIKSIHLPSITSKHLFRALSGSDSLLTSFRCSSKLKRRDRHHPSNLRSSRYLRGAIRAVRIDP